MGILMSGAMDGVVRFLANYGAGVDVIGVVVCVVVFVLVCAASAVVAIKIPFRLLVALGIAGHIIMFLEFMYF